MTKVYEERNLEGEHDHPDNRGWMNLFYHWSGSGMFRATWAVSISNYNGRFQQFCGRHLGLDIGRVQLGNRMQPGDAKSAHELLTNAEREHLRLLESANFDEELSWDNIAVVPLEVRVDQTDHTDETGFRFQIGIALIEGHFAIERDRQGRLETEPPRRRIRYFRIRDHLRRMGLGRRALEALWREDVKLQVDVPTDISLVIEEADPQGLLRLWHSVLAAVPNQELKLAHDLLNKVDENIDRKIKAQLGDEENAESKAIELRRTLPAPDDPDLERARSYYLAALKHQSDNEEAWRGIARVKAYRKDVAGAIAILDEVIRRDPNSSASYYNRAAIKMRMPEPDEKSSLNDLEKAIEIDFSLKTIARKDEDFNKIRKHRRFVRLIDKPMP
jgi:tetratricopeptide (TPR) repeat protein